MPVLKLSAKEGGSIELEIQGSVAEDLMPALPLNTEAKRWGDEIYFNVPVDKPKIPDARDTFKVGEVAYWPEGKAVAIFFGPTPASDEDGKPRAVVPINPIGHVRGDTDMLDDVEHGDTIRVERA